MSQEEKRELGRAEGGGKSKPKHVPVWSKHSPSPTVGRRVYSPGKIVSSIDKIHCMTQLTDLSEKNRVGKDSPSHRLVPFTWWKNSCCLETLGGADPQLFFSSSSVVAKPWCSPSWHHKYSRLWTDFLCFLQGSLSFTVCFHYSGWVYPVAERWDFTHVNPLLQLLHFVSHLIFPHLNGSNKCGLLVNLARWVFLVRSVHDK